MDYCEFCGHELAIIRTALPYGMTSVYLEQEECTNGACPNEFEYCDRCDEQLKFDPHDNEWLPCGCSQEEAFEEATAA